MPESHNRVYIASKLGSMEPLVNELKEQLEARGYLIIYDWTQNAVPKPFEEHLAEASQAAELMAKAVQQCDILIVLCAPNGLGMHIETGGALVSSIVLQFLTGQKRKQIYVVGEGNDRSIFYFHESVVRVPDIDTLLTRLH